MHKHGVIIKWNEGWNYRKRKKKQKIGLQVASTLCQPSYEKNIKLIDLFRCQLRLLLASNFAHSVNKCVSEWVSEQAGEWQTGSDR